MSPVRCPPKPSVEMRGVLCYVGGMKLTFDEETGMAYIRLSRKKVHHTYEYLRVNIDFDESDRVVGIEVFDQHLTLNELREMVETVPAQWWLNPIIRTANPGN